MASRPSPLGTWASPISSELIVSKVLRLSDARALPNGDVAWIESRPQEGGRNVLVLRSAADGSEADVTPPAAAGGGSGGFNVRTRVQEYGGGAVLLSKQTAFFSNFADQRVYTQPLAPGSTPAPLTASGAQRFGDYCLDAPRSRLLAVCEDHSGGEGVEAVTRLAAIDLGSGAVTQLVQGHDFYNAPRLSADGSQLAYVAWDHPNMPWDDTSLFVATLDAAGAVTSTRHVAGGKDTSVQQPRWGADGRLYFVSDLTGWWNLYRLEADGQARALLLMAAEFGSPPWLLGLHTYEPLGQDGEAVLAVFDDPGSAGSGLGLVDTAAGSLARLDTGLTSWGRLSVQQAADGGLTIVTIAGSASKPAAVVKLQVPSLAALAASKPGDWQVVKASSELQIDAGYLSEPRSIEFATAGNRTAFMNFYPPRNKDHTFPPGELPALLVRIHGGPTSAASTLFSLTYAWWTSRGFAIADINYSGSTGFGRDYRNRLRGQWGVADVDDCCAAAEYLADQGLVDAKRLCIDGGSAGGYTTLAALAFRSVFSAGASHFGVADAELLAQHTHKFESRYLDLLIGPYPAARELYRQRSPIHSADSISAPVALFQGDEDKVVPPEQAVVMHQALKAKGLPTALAMFQGEQHGFRKAENIRAALEGEFYFFGRVLGFPAAYSPGLQPLTIDNLSADPGRAAGKDEL